MSFDLFVQNYYRLVGQLNHAFKLSLSLRLNRLLYYLIEVIKLTNNDELA